MPANLHDDLADFLKVLRFIAGAHHGPVAFVESLEGAVEPAQFFFLPPAPGDVHQCGQNHFFAVDAQNLRR